MLERNDAPLLTPGLKFAKDRPPGAKGNVLRNWDPREWLCIFFMKEAGGKVLTTRGDQGSLTNADVSERINEIFDREDIYEVITKPPTIVCQLKQNLSDRPVNSEIWLFHEVFFIRTQRFPVKHLDIKSLTFKLEGILIYCSNDWKV